MSDSEQIQENRAKDLAKEPVVETVSPKKNGKRNRIVGYFILFFALLGLIAGFVWWFVFRNHETTDDAYVGGNMVVVTSRQEGSAIAFYADDTNFVKQGQLLVELDPTDYLLAFEERKAALEIAARQVRELFEDVKQREADVVLKEAVYRRSLTDYKNRMALVGSEAVSKEDYTHSRADLNVAKASLDLAVHQLEGAKSKLGTTPLRDHPMIEQAKINVKESFLALKRCSIFAPVSGFVAKRNIQAGQSLKTTTPLMAIIPLDHIWVEANFKETQLEDIRIGQDVEITADMYGSDVVYHAKVGGIQGGSGSVFSLLPPQNASGNWIKIVQRVPVRIYLDPKEVAEHPLFLGLSVFVKVFVEDTSGRVLSEQTPVKAVMETNVFEIPLDTLEPILEQLIESNLGFISATETP